VTGDRVTGDQVAVVTGGGSGIGLATCTRLAKDGFTVAVLDLRPDAAAGLAALTVTCDVTSEADVDIRYFDVELGRTKQLVATSAVAKDALDHRNGALGGARPICSPEEAAILVPNAIARAFLQHAGRKFDHLVHHATRLQNMESGAEHGLFALPLGMAKPRHQHLAVQHHRGIGRKHQIGNAFDRRKDLDYAARPLNGEAQRRR